MKIFYSCLVFIISGSILLAQNINQFDEAGKRHGMWEKNFKGTNILRYQGQFTHGKEVGVFKFYKNIRNKAVLSAIKTFSEQDNTAKVEFLASNGKLISEGVMNGKIYIGAWKYYHKNSKALLALEHYNDTGDLHGERFVYYPNEQIAEKQNYAHGKLEGMALWYSEKNVVLKEMIYENGELHGPAKFYNAKGELVSEGPYKRDKKDGVWKYYENGELIKEKDFTYIPKYKKKTP